MSELVAQLRAVMVRGELDLSELEEKYRDAEGEGLRIPFRLNWTRRQKERQRELQQETLALQERYVRLKGLVEDREAWWEEKREADKEGEENWRHWAEWWAGILLMEMDEVVALADAIPEQHWVWITAQVAMRAGEYEKGMVKKANDERSPSSGKRGGPLQKPGSEQD